MKPLVVGHPEPMSRVRVITIKDSSEKAIKALHRIGVMHIEEAKELKPIDRAAIESEKKEASELLNLVNNILSQIPEKRGAFNVENFEITYARPLKELAQEVKLLYGRVDSLRARIDKFDIEAQKSKELRKYLEPLAADSDLRMTDLNYSGEYLISRVFILPGEAFKNSEDRFKKLLLVCRTGGLENEVVLYAVAEVRNRELLDSQVADSGGRALPVPAEGVAVRDFLEANDARMFELEARTAELRQELKDKIGKDAERLVLLREALSTENERLSVLEKAAEGRYVTLIEGWIPQRDARDAISEIKQEIDYSFIDSRAPYDSEEPPTKLDNLAATKPFQVIVDLFGTPKYREWDPTPVVAYSFAVFFGIMTQDVVYAIGIILLAKFLLPKFTDNPRSEGFRLFQRVLYIGAGVGLVIGLITGSYLTDFFSRIFGLNIPPISQAVAQLFSTPITFILAAVGIGFVHVNIAHVLAFIIALKSRNAGVIVAKFGFFAVQIFIILYAAKALLNIAILNGISSNIFLYGLGASLLLLIIGVVMQSSFFGVMLWIFELTGLIGDILSYSRLAGVGMAGFYLGTSINMLAIIFRGMLPGPVGLIIGTIAAFLVLVAGHLINIVLSALSGVVHSMRLCLVEFMFKFYAGGGTKYSPFSLKNREALFIREKA